MQAAARLGRCVGCGAGVDEHDEFCRACGVPVAGSDELDLDVLSRGLPNEPIPDGVYGSRRQNVGFGVACLALGAGLMALAVTVVWAATTRDELRDDGIVLTLAALGMMAVPGAVALVYGRGLLRTALHIAADGIAVVGARPGQRRELPWSEIRRFDVGSIFMLAKNPTAALIVRLHDGGPVPVRTISQEGFIWNAAKQRACIAIHAAALNRRLLAARAGVV